MGIIRRQSIQTSLILVIGVVIGFVLRLYIFTKFLTPDQIGLLTVLVETANLFAAIIPLGSSSIFLRYLPSFRQGKPGSSGGLLFLGLTISCIGIALFAILYFIFQNPLSEYYAEQAPLFADYLIYLLPLVFVRVIYILGWGYSRAIKKNVFPNAIKEIIVRALTGVVVLAFAYHWFSLDGLIFWYVMVYFVSSAIMTYYIFNLGELDLKPQLSKFKNGKLKEIIFFGLFAIMTSIGSIVLRATDSIMLTTLNGTYDAGIYSIAFFIGMVIEIPRRSVSQITGPFIAEAAERSDTKMISKLYHKSSINQFLIGVILLICIWTNVDSLFEIIPKGNLYAEGKYVVLFIGLGKLFDMSMGVNNEIILNSPYYRFNFYTMSLLAVLGVITNLLLIPRFGLTGAAIASLISISLVNIIKAIFIHQKFKMQPFGTNTIVALLISFLAYMVAIFIPKLSNSYLDILLRGGSTFVIFTVLCLSLKISEDFNQLFIRFKGKLGL